MDNLERRATSMMNLFEGYRLAEASRWEAWLFVAKYVNEEILAARIEELEKIILRSDFKIPQFILDRRQQLQAQQDQANPAPSSEEEL